MKLVLPDCRFMTIALALVLRSSNVSRIGIVAPGSRIMPTLTSTSKLRQLAERDQRVFATYPLVARYFPASAVEDARQRLTRAIDRGDGPGLVIGAPGTGKSLLLQVLATQYHSKFDVVLLACARLCTRRAMLQAILFELGLPYKMRDEGDLRLSLLDHLLSDECPSGLLLLVDEAQALPTALLDELRILTNLVRTGVPRVRLVLAGSSSLEEAFANPELESFSQRLAARCYLAPLNHQETRQYILAQIAACGGTPDEVIHADACAAVFDATDGVPRLVNQLCDRALQLAFASGKSAIDRLAIQEAWSDLQQLPAPWDTPPLDAPATKSDVVEFGTLSDDSLSIVAACDEALLDDSTELELDDEPLADEPTATSTAVATTAIATNADPFAEQFDEEEVVLDNFSGWDDIFNRSVPRVQNRRDPGFSTMVQTAIDSSPVSSSLFTVSNMPSEKEVSTTSTADRPRLRLADVPDDRHAVPSTSTLKSIADLHTAKIDTSGILGTLEVEAVESPVATATEEPVLVIEDDIPHRPGPPSPVRREEFKNLFSRLRSG